MLKTKRALQVVLALAALVPVGAGASGILLGPAMVPGLQHVTISLDSHYRYLSGLLLGIGLTVWMLIPKVEMRGEPLRLIAAIVFIGGIARAWALYVSGLPDAAMIGGLIMELVVTPLLAFWQYKLARRLGYP